MQYNPKSKACSVQNFAGVLYKPASRDNIAFARSNGEMELGTQATATVIQCTSRGYLCKLTGVMDPNGDIFVIIIIITITISTEEKSLNRIIAHVSQ